MGLAGHCNARTEHLRRIPHFHHDDLQLHSWQLHQQVELQKVFSKISWRAHEGFIRQWSCMSSSELRMWWHTASLLINIPLSIFVASNSRLASRSSYSELLMTNGDLYWELRSCHEVLGFITTPPTPYIWYLISIPSSTEMKKFSSLVLLVNKLEGKCVTTCPSSRYSFFLQKVE